MTHERTQREEQGVRQTPPPPLNNHLNIGGFPSPHQLIETNVKSGSAHVTNCANTCTYEPRHEISKTVAF